MSIKNTMVRIAEKITGRKCCACAHNCGGRCCHPNGKTFMRCWQSITRPGFEYASSRHIEGSCNEKAFVAPGDLTEEELYEMGKIVESLQEASATAQDAGLLEDDEDDNWPQPW
jgi:hypothetical protein